MTIRKINSKSNRYRFLGDIFLDKEYSHPYSRDELLIVNHEYAVNYDNVFEPQVNRICLKVSKEYIDKMFADRQLIVSFANNHAQDFGETCLKKNVETLENKGIYCFGSGTASNDFNCKCIIENSFNFRCGVLFYCHKETFSYDYFDQEKYGISLFTENKFLKHCDEIKQHIDYLVVYIHWGDEFFHLPNRKQVELANKISKHANLIVGSHSHCVQLKKKVYPQCDIFYSAGNTLFPNLDKNNNINTLSNNLYENNTFDSFNREWSKLNNISLSVCVDTKRKTIFHQFHKFKNNALIDIGIIENLLIRSIMSILGILPDWFYPTGRWMNGKLRNLLYRLTKIIHRLQHICIKEGNW